MRFTAVVPPSLSPRVVPFVFVPKKEKEEKEEEAEEEEGNGKEIKNPPKPWGH